MHLSIPYPNLAHNVYKQIENVVRAGLLASNGHCIFGRCIMMSGPFQWSAQQPLQTPRLVLKINLIEVSLL